MDGAARSKDEQRDLRTDIKSDQRVLPQQRNARRGRRSLQTRASGFGRRARLYDSFLHRMVNRSQVSRHSKTRERDSVRSLAIEGLVSRHQRRRIAASRYHLAFRATCLAIATSTSASVSLRLPCALFAALLSWEDSRRASTPRWVARSCASTMVASALSAIGLARPSAIACS